MMIFTLDIGNTNAKAVVYENGNILAKASSPDPDAIYSFLTGFPNAQIGVSSVNPSFYNSFADLLHQSFPDSAVHFISSESKLNFKNSYETPETLGADRICGMAGAVSLADDPGGLIISIDAGTCITVDVYNGGEYTGGFIAPGIDMMLKALHQFTGKLPRVEKFFTEELTGKSTADSIMKGVLTFVNSLPGYISELEKKYNKNSKVYLTGGSGIFIKPLLPANAIYEENLVNLGIYRLTELNSQ